MTTTVALSGAQGFLGWHTRAALRHDGVDARAVALGAHFDEQNATRAIDGAARVLHLAGVNRGSDSEVGEGNVLFARQLSTALLRAERKPRTVVYANSIQAGNGSVYGTAKEEAAHIVAEAASTIGAEYVDLRLPNLFGEHGRPFYNSVTATFSHLLAQGGDPEVSADKELTLLHAQNAADLLTGRVPHEAHASLQVHETVSGLLRRLSGFAQVYARGEIPDIADEFDRDLFNTYRSYTFPEHTPIPLTRHADGRGSFFEIVRSRGGQGQSSFSTTVPGISRGDHFHRRKVERFTVLAGTGIISLRRLFTDEVYEFDVSGETPVAIDMPTMWAHRIENTGTVALYTSFWSNEIFDTSRPDTIAEVV